MGREPRPAAIEGELDLSSGFIFLVAGRLNTILVGAVGVAFLTRSLPMPVPVFCFRPSKRA
jgi:hypothetical protein